MTQPHIQLLQSLNTTLNPIKDGVCITYRVQYLHQSFIKPRLERETSKEVVLKMKMHLSPCDYTFNQSAPCMFFTLNLKLRF